MAAGVTDNRTDLMDSPSSEISDLQGLTARAGQQVSSVLRSGAQPTTLTTESTHGPLCRKSAQSVHFGGYAPGGQFDETQQCAQLALVERGQVLPGARGQAGV